MFFYEGYICPVCKQKFNETDDIVACPDCGAPHHRACWQQVGHCQFAADHGTPQQWRRPVDVQEPAPASPSSAAATAGRERVCPQCGTRNVEFAEFCSHCGAALTPIDWDSASAPSAGPAVPPPPFPPAGGPGYGEYTPFRMPVVDPCGGVPREEDIDGVTAEELAVYVGPNAPYYVPRFHKMARTGSTIAWNWPAFLIPHIWLLYRKQYLAGGIALAFFVLQSFLTGWIQYTFIYPSLDMTSNAALMQSLRALLQSGSKTMYLAVIGLLTLVGLLVRILLGLTGTALYRRNTVGRIRKLSAPLDTAGSPLQREDYRRSLSETGGVSFVLVTVAAGITWLGEILCQSLFYLNL